MPTTTLEFIQFATADLSIADSSGLMLHHGAWSLELKNNFNEDLLLRVIRVLEKYS